MSLRVDRDADHLVAAVGTRHRDDDAGLGADRTTVGGAELHRDRMVLPEDGHSTTNPMATATAANDRTPMTTHRAA